VSYEIHVCERITQPEPTKNSSGLQRHLFKAQVTGHTPQCVNLYKMMKARFPEPGFRVEVVYLRASEVDSTLDIEDIIAKERDK
jgi:hypothetical protein